MKRFSITLLMLLGSLNAQNISVNSAGWHLLGAIEDINNMNVFSSECVEYVYKYDKEWLVHSNSTKTISGISQGQGFWLKAKSSCQIDTTKVTTISEDTTTLSSDMKNLKDKVQTIIDTATEAGVVGVQVSLRSSKENFSIASGYSNLENKTKLSTSDIFRADSNTKSMVGLISAILHADGKLDLYKPISTYLANNYKDKTLNDKIANTTNITQRILLTHASGLADYVSNGFEEFSEENPTFKWNDYEAIKYIFNEPLAHETGIKFEYSNSGYLLAGIVLDSVLGYDYAKELRERVFEPLNMQHTFYQNRDGEEINGNVVNMYIKSPTSKDFTNNSNVNTGWGLSDGGMLSNATDLAVYIEALGTYNSKIFNENVRSEYFKPSEFDSEYCLGINRVSQGESKYYISHTGSWTQSISRMVHNQENGYSMAYMVNMNVVDENSNDSIDMAFKNMLGELDNLFDNL